MTAPPDPAIRTVVFDDADMALAVSARVTMGRPAFARLRFDMPVAEGQFADTCPGATTHLSVSQDNRSCRNDGRSP